MTRLTIPRGARVIGRISGPAGHLTVWAGKASDGYKTDFERRPAYWWDLRLDDGRHHVRRYSGVNVKRLVSDFAEVAADPQVRVDQPLGLDIGLRSGTLL